MERSIVGFCRVDGGRDVRFKFADIILALGRGEDDS